MVYNSFVYTENDTVPFAKGHERFQYMSRWIVRGILRKCCYGEEYIVYRNILYSIAYMERAV